MNSNTYQIKFRFVYDVLQATLLSQLYQVTIAEFASKDGNLFGMLEMIPVFGIKLPII